MKRLLAVAVLFAIGVVAQDDEELSAVYKPATMPMKSTTCSALNRAEKETKEIKLSESPLVLVSLRRTDATQRTST